MTVLTDLLRSQDRERCAGPPETDALRDEDALVEAALLDLRLEVTTGSLWLLFDCRGALQLSTGNAAVVVVHEVTHLAWDATQRSAPTGRAVMGWVPRVEAGRFVLVAETEPGGRLEVTGTEGEFFVGAIPGGDDPPPDFTRATGAEIRAGLAGWSSEFEVLGASFLTATPGPELPKITGKVCARVDRVRHYDRAGPTSDRGPVQFEWDDETVTTVDARTDLTVAVSDERWRDPYASVTESERRDLEAEIGLWRSDQVGPADPLHRVVGRAVEAFEPIFDPVGQLIGVTLRFGSVVVTARIADLDDWDLQVTVESTP